jgi:hypothetical protein
MSTEAHSKDFLTPTAAILLPAGQAAVSALAIGVTAGSLAILAKAENPWAIAGLTAGVGLGVSWLAGLSWWRARVEGLRAETAQVFPTDTVRLDVYTGENPTSPYLRGAFNEIKISPEALKWALIHLAGGGDLSMGAMCGPGKISRSEFCTIRDVLIDNNLAAWKNPRAHAQGSVVLVAGKRAAVRYLNAYNPPPGVDIALKAVD